MIQSEALERERRSKHRDRREPGLAQRMDAFAAAVGYATLVAGAVAAVFFTLIHI